MVDVAGHFAGGVIVLAQLLEHFLALFVFVTIDKFLSPFTLLPFTINLRLHDLALVYHFLSVV